MKTIEGPLGPFKIPESAHPRTAEVCEFLSRQVFGNAETPGEYDHPDLPTFPGRPPHVLDLGAGWGAFTVFALKRWPGCLVRAYEPHDAAADVWRENVTGPDSMPDYLKSGWAYLQRAAVTTNPKPTINGAEDWGAYHVAAADDACAWPVAGWHPKDLPPCDVFKLDVEGLEVEILEAYPYLDGCEALLAEYHSIENRDRVFAIATSVGFRCVKSPPVEATYGATVWVKP